MHNFLEDPVPDDPIQRVHAFARDLAYGAVMGLWSSRLRVRIDSNLKEIWYDTIRRKELELLYQKWGSKLPSWSLTLSFEYMYLDDKVHVLTPKALALLEQPAPASIFISYSRRESSAFALLILARFKAIDLEPFLDIRGILPGDDWHAELEQEVRQRENFICLIGLHTLESPYVRKEIEWALDAGVRTIPIWHNGFRYDESINPDPELENFLKRHAIVVEKEDAKAYQSAIDELLNYFGVTPT